MKCKNCKKTFTPINRGNVICSKECLFEFYENKSQFEKLTKKIRKEDNKEIRLYMWFIKSLLHRETKH